MRPAKLLFTILILSLVGRGLSAAEVLTGYHPKVSVTAETRLDWIFALANQSPKAAPAEWLKDYESTKQTYEFYAPAKAKPRQALPAVIFVSPSGNAMGWRSWKTACEKLGMVFAGPHQAGNNCPMPRRMRIVMDVLDDVRRRYNIDPDRTYIAGFSGGGRIACSIAFALPEYFGGAIPVCAAGDLRSEPWLSQRVIDRLSVAMLTGETDFNRSEVERFRGPMLSDVGLRTKIWVYPKMGHGVPSGESLVEVHQWLDEAATARKKLAKQYPASRIDGSAAPSRDQWAANLLTEAKSRLKNPKTLYSGLMQLKGISARWPDVPAAAEAKQILIEYDRRKEHPWEAADIAEQRKFLIARSRALDAYASGPLPGQYANQRPDMLSAAINLWTQVVLDGNDKAAVAEAKRRIPELKAIAQQLEKKQD